MIQITKELKIKTMKQSYFFLLTVM